MKKEVLELIKYRLEEAEDSIKEAEVLLKEGMSMRGHEPPILRNVLCCFSPSSGKRDGNFKTCGGNFFI
jgi:hypothetical protein